MTLAQYVEHFLGADRYQRVKSYSFKDSAYDLFGEERYNKISQSLDDILFERDFSNKNLKKIAKETRNALQKIGKETYYEFAVDAIAQNLCSLVYIFNDRYSAGQSWMGAIGTRMSAAVGNTITGRPYGAWQDYVISIGNKYFNLANEKNPIKKFVKNWFTKACAFAAGQSWLYALFLISGDKLAGDETDYAKLGVGVATLTLLSPLLGPLSDKGYQYIRTQFGLPKVPLHRKKSEQAT